MLVEGGELSGSLEGGGRVELMACSSSPSWSAPGHFLQSPDTQGQSLLVAQAVEARVLRGGILISWELQEGEISPLLASTVIAL